jgi:hypothetical protein
MSRYIGTDRLLYGSDCAFKADGAVIKLAEVMREGFGTRKRGERCWLGMPRMPTYFWR